MSGIVVLVEDFPAAPGPGDKGDVVVVGVLGAEEGDAGGAADGYLGVGSGCWVFARGLGGRVLTGAKKLS